MKGQKAGKKIARMSSTAKRQDVEPERVLRALKSIGDAIVTDASFARHPMSTPTKIRMALGWKARGKKVPNSNRFGVVIEFNLNGVADGSDKPYLSLSVVYLIQYSTIPGSEFSDDDLQEFARTNCVFNAWAYLREFLQSACNRMGLPPLPLPAYKYGTSGVNSYLELARVGNEKSPT